MASALQSAGSAHLQPDNLGGNVNDFLDHEAELSGSELLLLPQIHDRTNPKEPKGTQRNPKGLVLQLVEPSPAGEVLPLVLESPFSRNPSTVRWDEPHTSSDGVYRREPSGRQDSPRVSISIRYML